jgi:ADP-ribosyl-[dinitrogen reductase] hydrolase
MDGSNAVLLDRLFTERKIAVERGELFATAPPALPQDLAWDRVEGMLLGLAIGDSLGNPTEGMLPLARQAFHGLVRGYPRHRAGREHAVGLPSDDTQLAFWTLEQLIEDRGLVPDRLAARFCREPIFGIGQTVARFVVAYRDEGVPWYAAGPRSAGNGALMRIAPIVVTHLRQPTPLLWTDAALAAMLTHNDPASIAACLAWVRLLWESLRLNEPPEPGWWLEPFCATAGPLEGETAYATRTSHQTYVGPLWRFAEESVRRALDENWPVLDACNQWHSGAYLLETVPCALYLLERCAHDPEETILGAVNDTVDNDTIAAIVGTVVGALHGKSRLPARWLDGLLGRTAEADDGRVFELIAAARTLWWGT